MKIVLAPMNIADMPVKVVRELCRRGHTAEHVQYTLGQGQKFKYSLDQEMDLNEHGGRIKTHTKTIKHYLDRDFDLFHFWNKSMFYEGQYRHLTGLDIPLIKARGKRVVYRFTGYDARLPSWDLEVNPFSTFRYGYKHLFDEELQKKYHGFLQEYVDQFIVQDPEMAQFAPDSAIIIPRALDLTEWEFVGLSETECPLIVHAPSMPAVKGTEFIEAALDELRSEGLKFEYKRIKDMPHDVARNWYKRADIVVDQILIGATGVLTLEAWALGKPVVLYLREDLFQPFYNTSELPVANANPDTIKKVLRKLIKDKDWRQHLSRAGRKTVEDYHDIRKVIHQYENVYQATIANDIVTPSGTRDIDYLCAQAEISQNLTIVVNQTQRNLAEAKKDARRKEERAIFEENTEVAQDLDTQKINAFEYLSGDEKLEILSALLPKYIYLPVKAVVLIRRHTYFTYLRARQKLLAYQEYFARR